MLRLGPRHVPRNNRELASRIAVLFFAFTVIGAFIYRYAFGARWSLVVTVTVASAVTAFLMYRHQRR
jgi:hypothetical protein